MHAFDMPDRLYAEPAAAGLDVAGGWRQAALVLRAMGAADRHWLLGQLLPQEREALGGLLEELESLGLPNDPTFLQNALHADSARPHAPLPTVGSAAARTAHDPELQSRPVAVVAEVLRDEPAVVAALCLQNAEPDWRDALLAQFGQPHRAKVRLALAEPLAGTVAGQQLRLAVLRAVSTSVDRLASETPGLSLPHSRSGLARLRSVLGRWRHPTRSTA